MPVPALRRSLLGILFFVILTTDIRAQSDHWAFQPLTRPTPPTTHGDPPRNPIDAFIRAKLHDAGLSQNPEADRRTLIRRLYFDVLGLPPTPETINEFLGDDSPDAYERLVDRVLASPAYGERWARHWLDVVRFAESHGFETNLARPNAWPYRDYVVESFNADKPFDQFVREQIAGDAWNAPRGTGFLVAGPWDKVKSPDPVLTAQQRADELHDIVSTTGSAFLGLTIGCARCHDHKFDPISQRDYYAVTAIFAGVQHGERAIPRVKDEQTEARIAQLQAQLDKLDQRIAEFQPPIKQAVTALANVDEFEPVTVQYLRFVVLDTSNGEPCLDELEVFTPEPEPRNVALASAGTMPTSSGNYANNPKHQLKHINDGRYGNQFSWISNETGKGWVQLRFAKPERINRVVWSRDRGGEDHQYNDRLATEYRIEVSSDGSDWTTVADSSSRYPEFRGLPSAIAKRARDLVEQRSRLDAEITKLQAPFSAYLGKFTQPGPTHLLYRGDPMMKRDVVAPSGLTEFGHTLKLARDAPERQRRMAFARWLTEDNPLTTRVIVNRLWHYHFGTGIVDTPSDFGANGARPTHPELLDWLASELTAPGPTRWRLKRIHRLILLSATYRQSSESNPDGLKRDGDSRLLWRFPPQRLEAEPLRDAILSVSGQLNRRMGGPGFDLFEPNDNYVKVYQSKTEFGPETFRRMVYQSKPRMRLDDTFGAFDCPDGGQVAPDRNSSITALQALNLLNSPFIMQQAELFAQRLRREAGEDAAEQANRAFSLAFGRSPEPAEREAAIKLIEEHGLVIFCRALFNANEFLYVR